jgi:hypothetical protein
MEITNSCDFLGSRYPWVTDGRSPRAACRVPCAVCLVPCALSPSHHQLGVLKRKPEAQMQHLTAHHKLLIPTAWTRRTRGKLLTQTTPVADADNPCSVLCMAGRRHWSPKTTLSTVAPAVNCMKRSASPSPCVSARARTHACSTLFWRTSEAPLKHTPEPKP